MKQEKLLTTLVAPHLSEKSLGLGDAEKQVVFKVSKRANKADVKQAIESMFDVKVDRVRIVNVKGKTKTRARGNTGRRPSWKKAYVSLQEGHDIDFMGAE
ncbi:MAG: 50S ribosomal protein L23 [Gammaproteobacteria bacterium]|nr:50S ribosomal protein L23 [Gammaproteobacteria bacterium]MDH5728680.1 50S ribosomal protein L23 [Gammaproteobacteria bacterium]